MRSGDPSNVEAQAARIYWESYLSNARFYRDPNADDVVNGLLNYGYTILRGRVLTRIVAAGLSPTLSLFHRNRSNVFALADDLVEPFRPVIDCIVLELLDAGATGVERAEKARLAAVLDEMGESSQITVRTSLERLCQSFALYVEGERESLHVPVWDVSSAVAGAEDG